MDIAVLNQQRLAPLYPPLIASGNKFIVDCAAQQVKILITQGLRTWQQQDALYAQGRTTPGKIVTNARGGQSYHNFGLAFDIVPIAINGTPIWDTSNRAWSIAKEIGELHEGSVDTRLDPAYVAQVIADDLDLELGADWVKFRDTPHYEMTGGVSLPILRTLYKPNDLSACWNEITRRINSPVPNK